MQLQQQVRVPEFISELSQPQILFQTCSVPFWSLGGTFPHCCLWYDTTSCLGYVDQMKTPLREWRVVPHLEAAASGCVLVKAEFPQLQGTVMTKLSKLILDASLPNLTDYGEVMSLYMQAYTSSFLLSYRDSVCVGWLEGPLLLTWSIPCSASVSLPHPIFSQHDRI